MCITNRHDMTLAVKVELNDPNTTDLKTFWIKEKMLIISMFSLSQNAFYLRTKN